MSTILNRLYSDYVMPSRLDEYERFVLCAMKAGYLQTSVRSFYKFLVRCKNLDERIIVHRHDIDTDVRTARKIFEIERKYNIRSSYYFRIATLDFTFMREIEEYGSEASYHYEEIANFAKRNHIKDANEILRHMPDIRHEFFNNFSDIEKRLGKKLTTVASHGDFSNRRLKLANHEILKDHELRERCGIECESYDRTLLDGFDIYISDRPYPHYYHPVSPFHAIQRYNKICFLTHPRQWETNWIGHTKDNLLRLYEGWRW